MFICNFCGRRFDDPAHRRESYGELVKCCPTCGSTDYDDATNCPLCNQLYVDKGGLACPQCVERVRAVLTDNLAETDYELALEILEELYDNTL